MVMTVKECHTGAYTILKVMRNYYQLTNLVQLEMKNVFFVFFLLTVAKLPFFCIALSFWKSKKAKYASWKQWDPLNTMGISSFSSQITIVFSIGIYQCGIILIKSLWSKHKILFNIMERTLGMVVNASVLCDVPPTLKIYLLFKFT